jgi:hypothetical protein
MVLVYGVCLYLGGVALSLILMTGYWLRHRLSQSNRVR